MKVAYGYFVHVHRQHWAIECYCKTGNYLRMTGRYLRMAELSL
jgi:hypothetical protein